jgi:anthranilate phosphoribosyltransferase
VSEHPFAPYVRELGRGKTGARSLDAAEAETAMGMILDGEAEPAQIGAFLMLLRVREESAAELIGFTRAARKRISPSLQSLAADLDWPSYAGKRQHHPWFLLSALLLACSGYRVVMHGCEPHADGRLFTGDALAQLGISAAGTLEEAAQRLDARCFAYLPLRMLNSRLQELLNLRALLGLRSPINTFIRHLNPCTAGASLLSLHHPAYAPLHIATLTETHAGSALIFRGDGGECEIRPDAETRCLLMRARHTRELSWPRSVAVRALKPEAPQAAALEAVWEEKIEDAYAERAIIDTAAAGLMVLGKAATAREAIDIANRMWRGRPSWQAMLP